MLVDVNQRWRRRRASYRPQGETINPMEFEVTHIPDDTTAKKFVLKHHYSGSYPAARRRFGLYRKGGLVGVAVFSIPVQPRSLDCAPGPRETCLELGRLVLLDDVRANGESWFISRCFHLLKSEGFTGVISFSDPVPRSTSSGEILFRGHVGTIYQATNGTYLGRSSAHTKYLLPDGSVIHRRALTKIRHHQQGWRYSAEILERHGAAPLSGDPVEWVNRWLPVITRRLRHQGNHKYVWALNRRDRRSLPPSKPYPKFEISAR